MDGEQVVSGRTRYCKLPFSLHRHTFLNYELTPTDLCKLTPVAIPVTHLPSISAPQALDPVNPTSILDHVSAFRAISIRLRLTVTHSFATPSFRHDPTSDFDSLETHLVSPLHSIESVSLKPKRKQQKHKVGVSCN